MFIENAELKVNICCENESCSNMLSLGFSVAADDIATLPSVKNVEEKVAKTWIVRDGMAFCSTTCEIAARNSSIRE